MNSINKPLTRNEVLSNNHNNIWETATQGNFPCNFVETIFPQHFRINASGVNISIHNKQNNKS